MRTRARRCRSEGFFFGLFGLSSSVSARVFSQQLLSKDKLTTQSQVCCADAGLRRCLPARFCFPSASSAASAKVRSVGHLVLTRQHLRSLNKLTLTQLSRRWPFIMTRCTAAGDLDRADAVLLMMQLQAWSDAVAKLQFPSGELDSNLWLPVPLGVTK